MKERSTIYYPLVIVLAIFLLQVQPSWAQLNIYEAEDAAYSGTRLRSSGTARGGQYLDFHNNNNDYIEWTIPASNTGKHIISFFYQLGWGNDRPLELSVNGEVVNESASFPYTGDWTNWSFIDYEVDLVAGPNTVRITAIGFSGGNFDYISVSNPPSVNVKVNFSTISTPAPAGWLQDFGLAYGNRGNNLKFGWVEPGTATPIDLTANGMNRGPIPNVDVLRESHMAMDADFNGIPDGEWQVEVPNGSYSVIVQVGDALPELIPGTRHLILVESDTLADYLPKSNAGVRNFTKTVVVSDGFLTLSSPGGLNTKVNMVIVESLDGFHTPAILGSFPTDGAVSVLTSTSISANFLHLPNESVGGATSLDNTTITTETVKLYEITPSGDVLVESTVNGTGGGDAINLTPVAFLKPNTSYRFVIQGTSDLASNPVLQFSTVFTTIEEEENEQGSENEQIAFQSLGVVAAGDFYTSLTFGPEGRLYGLTLDGAIHRWFVNPDGTLASQQILTEWMQTYGSRSAVGLVFDPNSTPANPIAYISHVTGGYIAEKGAPEWDGKISRLTGPNLENEELIVTNLPRSVRDHLSNSLAFRPGEDHAIYFNQGSNSAGGAADGAWGLRPEHLLSAACLRLDLNMLPAQLPLNVQTTSDLAVINSADVNSPTMSDGTYNPYYVDAPLTLFASGVRNAYDLVWHSNGQLYIPTNGTAGGSRSPASVPGTRRPDGSFYSGQQIPALSGNESQRDWMFRVDPNLPIGYYGHPNPLRGEYVHNRGPIDCAQYPPNISADVNYRGVAYDFGFNKSPNGVIEYKSEANNGNLKGAMLVCRYSGGSDLIALYPDGPNGDIRTDKIGIPGFDGFIDPLDLVENPLNGYLYVSDVGRQEIFLLRPVQELASVALDKSMIIMETVINHSSDTSVSLTNNGTVDLYDIQINLDGEDHAEFTVNPMVIDTLKAGDSLPLTLSFSSPDQGPKTVDLNVQVSGLPVRSGTINALAKYNEPSLQWIADTQFGHNTLKIGDNNASTSAIHGNGQTVRSLLMPFSDEIIAPRFEIANGTNPVTIEVVGIFALSPVKTDTFVVFGVLEGSDITTCQPLFSSVEDQKMKPTVVGSQEFVPNSETFSFYTRWPQFDNRLVYGQDDLNVFPGSIPHQVRVYKVPNEEDAYLLGFENDVSSFDYQDLAIIIRNVKPVKAGIRVENLTKMPGSNRSFPADDYLVMNRIKRPANFGSVYRADTLETLRIHNEGDFPLVLTDIDLLRRNEFMFELPNNDYDTVPYFVSPGEYYDVLINFRENGTENTNKFDSLIIESNGATQYVTLAGNFKLDPEGGNEPSPFRVIELFGFQIELPRPMPLEYPSPDELASGGYGDLVTSDYWEQADPSQPVTAVFMMANSNPNDKSSRLIDRFGNTVDNFEFSYAVSVDGEVQCQMVFPEDKANPGQIAGYSGHVSQPFQVYIDKQGTGGTFNDPPNLKTKLFQVYDHTGKLIPNDYVAIQDAGNVGNGDFNDQVIYFSNIKPKPEGDLPERVIPCDEINFRQYPVFPLYQDDDQGTAAVQNNGDGLLLEGDAAKAIEYPIQVTPYTRINFDFKSDIQGEYHSIGFAQDLIIDDETLTLAQLFGTGENGFTDFKDYPGDGQFKSYSLPIGELMEGNYKYIVFTSKGRSDANSFFQNVKIFEDTLDIGDVNCDLVAPPEPCQEFNFYAEDFVDQFENVAASADYSIEEGGISLKLEDDAWKAIETPISLSSHSILKFEFRTSEPGAIHAIGFAHDLTTDPGNIFQIHGDQSYGNGGTDPYTAGGAWQTFIIPIGQLLPPLGGDPTREFSRLVFIADGGNTQSDVNSYFRNVQIFTDVDGNGFCDEGPNPEIIGESGTVLVDDVWKSVAFQNTYQNPVVVAGMPSREDSAQALSHIRNITTSGFEIRVDEWDCLDGIHGQEEIHYVVMEAGSHELLNGSMVQAGIDQHIDQWWNVIEFPRSMTKTFSIFGSRVTENAEYSMALRFDNGNTNANQTRMRFQRFENNAHVNEKASWIAIEKGSFNGLNPYEVNATEKDVTHEWFDIELSRDFGQNPVFISHMTSFYGNDKASSRYADSSGTVIRVMTEEEPCSDEEISHTAEEVQYMVFMGPGDILGFPLEVPLSNNSLSANPTLGEEASQTAEIALQYAQVYPNPVQDLTQLSLKPGNIQPYTVSLFSPFNELIWEQRMEAGEHTLNLASLPTGLYTLRVVQDLGVEVIKLLVE